MSALDRLLIGSILAAAALFAGVQSVRHYGATRYQAGWDGAVAAGKEARDSAATANLAIESGLRAQLLDRDTLALRKEQEYATNLDAAQRRVRAGDDRLRCPASAVQPAAPAGDRPAASAPAADGSGPDLMPEAASDVLSYGAAIAGLVRRYDEVVYRSERCQAVNAK